MYCQCMDEVHGDAAPTRTRWLFFRVHTRFIETRSKICPRPLPSPRPHLVHGNTALRTTRDSNSSSDFVQMF